MTTLGPTTRRADFDEITTGWGADDAGDLAARCQLLAEWWQANFPLTQAELKIARAMKKRLFELTGTHFEEPTLN